MKNNEHDNVLSYAEESTKVAEALVQEHNYAAQVLLKEKSSYRVVCPEKLVCSVGGKPTRLKVRDL